MKIGQVHKHKRLVVGMAVGIVLISVTAGSFFMFAQPTLLPRWLGSHTSLTQRPAFPDIDKSSLSSEQMKLISVLKTEYALNPAGTKYSDGITEPWCADFVSWVFKEAGAPLINPHSGGWRIPGTFTLREYYGSVGKLQLATAGYSPKTGDIMLYDDPSPFGQHTNIVIKNDHGVITTIGGNEPGGIRIVEHTDRDDAGFIGYGVF